MDDLAALATALNVSPITLLMPETSTGEETVKVTGRPPDDAGAVWDWLRALLFRGYEDMESLVNSNPTWAIEGVLQIAGMQRALARKAAGIPPDQVHTLGVIRRGND